MAVGSFDDFSERVMAGDGTKEKGRVGSANNPEHDALLKHVKDLLKISRGEMQKHYSTWDYNDQVFRSRKVLDKEDRSANAKGQPAKLILPMTFSQVLTFVSFAVMTTTQNERFFELEQTGTQTNPLKDPIELILERDLRKNAWNTFLVQFFLDAGKFGIAAAEVGWKEEYRNIRLPQTQTMMGAFGVPTEATTTTFQQIPKFIGNKVWPVSPYRFFPDTRLPIVRFQEGEFCGSEDMFSISVLQSDESGDLFNLDKIPKMTEKEYTERRKSSRIETMEFMPTRSQGGGDGQETPNPDGLVRSGPVVVTKCVFDMVPKNFQLTEDKDYPIGDEDFPVRYIVWYANDKTIIKFEEAKYLHGQFPYICAEYLPDQQKTLGEGLADTCDQIQNLCTWLTNAHIADIRSTQDGGKFIIDPSGIDIRSLESRSPYLFLKKNAAQTGVDRYIKQFQVQPITQNFMSDVMQLKELLEQFTGQSNVMQGQYSGGRRDATQSKAVIQGGSARGKLILSGIWDSAFEPLARQLIANNRQEMDIETFLRIVGQQTDPTKPPTELLFQLFQANPMTIATAEDFFVFDGTLPSEKSYLAQSLQEILMEVLSNPQVAMVLGYGPEQIRFLFNEIYTLRGVTPPLMPPAIPLPQPGQAPGQPPGQPPGGPPGLPGPPPTAGLLPPPTPAAT